MYFHELTRPAVPLTIRLCAQDYLQLSPFSTPDTFNSGKAGALIGALNKVCDGDENRRLVQGFLFLGILGKEMSSKAFKPQHWVAISNWVDQRLDGDGWVSHPALETEVEWILEVINKGAARTKQVASQKVVVPKPVQPVDDGLVHF